MLYIQRSTVNSLVLNINNNSLNQFTTYTLSFTHLMSKETTNFYISTSDMAQFTSNVRYCTITLDLVINDLPYLGQYQLNVFGDGTQEVYVTIVDVEQPDTVETNPFTEYISPNEINENYIYIQED